MVDISKTIVAKSDQLNADDLLTDDLIIKITKVDVTKDPHQPVIIHYEGECGKPYKPCKGMRRVIAIAWGAESDNYIGRSMKLFRDGEVKWAGSDVGGIRISEMSDIPKQVIVFLTVARGKKKVYKVNPLKVEDKEQNAKDWADNYIKHIENFNNLEDIGLYEETHKTMIKSLCKYPDIFKAFESKVLEIKKQYQKDVK
jgi:hypothetical protein